MEYQTNPNLSWQLLSGVITLMLGVAFQLRPGEKRKSTAFSLLMFGIAIWSFGNAVQWISPDLTWQIRWNTGTYLGIVIVPTAWFLLATELSGYGRKQVERWRHLFWLMSTLIFVAILTNPYHKLFFTSFALRTQNEFTFLAYNYGILFNLHNYYSYILLILGSILMVFTLFTNSRSYGYRSYGLVIGVLSILVGSLHYLFGSLPDPIQITFTIAGVAFAWVIFSEVSPVSQTETNQEKTRKIYHAILDSLQGSYFEADPQGVITYANLAFAQELGGTDKADVIGKHFRFLTDRIAVREIYGHFKLLYNTKLPIKPFEYHYHRKDGKAMIGEAYISPILVDGEVVGSRGFIRDITERIKYEVALRETTHNLGERVKELNCLYGISGLVETLGITLDEILQGTVDLIPPAFQYPEITCARIVLEEQEFKTENFAGSAWKMFADILVNGMKSGYVEVHCLDEIPDIDSELGPFQKEERNLINAIAERLGQITERQRQADRMTTLYQVGLATTSSLDIEEVLVTIYDQCRHVLSADVFYVALFDEDSKEIVYPVFYDHGVRLEPFRLPMDTGLAGWIIRNQCPFRCDDLVVEADHLPVKMHRTGGKLTRAYVGVPLLGRKGAIGVLSSQSYQAGAFKDEDVQLLTTLATQAVGAVENAQLFETAQSAAKELERRNLETLKQKDLLDGLLQNAPLAIVINDMQNRITVVSPAFQELFGYTQDDVLGRNLDDILSTPEIIGEMKELTEKVLEERVYTVGQRKRKDGILLDVEMFAEPLYVGGEKYGFMVFYNDISKRLEAEAERDQTQATYRAVMDTLQDPYFEADRTCVITYANLGYVKTVGFKSNRQHHLNTVIVAKMGRL